MTPDVVQSALSPAGPQAALLEMLWWFIFWIACGVFVLVAAALAGAVLRRKPAPTPDPVLARYVGMGVGLTVVILFVWLVASVRAGRAMSTPQMDRAVTINLTGRQWWWQVEYVDSLPANRFLTANEIHVPVGRPIVVNVTSRDVIHSFWVPALHGKRDLIPGQTTSIWFSADRPGEYRGQCAEFCGYQHAHMGIRVRAESAAEFQKWLSGQRSSAVEPGTELAQRGRDALLGRSCVQCHTIRGTSAGAAFGPDLTHVGSRATIGADTLPNTQEHLRQWIANPQRFKPGSKMPPQQIDESELTAIAAYLGQLR